MARGCGWPFDTAIIGLDKPAKGLRLVSVSEHPSVAIIRDLEARNRELEARVRALFVDHHKHAFSSVIDALQYGSLTVHDLAAAVAPERVRAALFQSPFTPPHA
jgi:hypothetical protein